MQGDGAGLFQQGVGRKVVNGESKSFFNDLWLDVVRLQSRFRCLFELCVDFIVVVADTRGSGLMAKGWRW